MEYDEKIIDDAINAMNAKDVEFTFQEENVMEYFDNIYQMAYKLEDEINYFVENDMPRYPEFCTECVDYLIGVAKSINKSIIHLLKDYIDAINYINRFTDGDPFDSVINELVGKLKSLSKKSQEVKK